MSIQNYVSNIWWKWLFRISITKYRKLIFVSQTQNTWTKLFFLKDHFPMSITPCMFSHSCRAFCTMLRSTFKKAIKAIVEWPLREVWTQIFLKHIECYNFQTISVMYIKVYISGMEMSQRIHFWYQILLKMVIFWENGKNHLFGQKFLWQANKIDLSQKCPNFWKIT